MFDIRHSCRAILNFNSLVFSDVVGDRRSFTLKLIKSTPNPRSAMGVKICEIQGLNLFYCKLANTLSKVTIADIFFFRSHAVKYEEL